jgi:hypothetical protein
MRGCGSQGHPVGLIECVDWSSDAELEAKHHGVLTREQIHVAWRIWLERLGSGPSPETPELRDVLSRTFPGGRAVVLINNNLGPSSDYLLAKLTEFESGAISR